MKKIRTIVRIAGHDVDGTLSLGYALAQIRGIGINLAYAISKVANLELSTRVGFLDDEDIERIEDIIKDPVKYGIPSWLVNRPKDLKIGEDRHLIGSDLELQVKEDTSLMRKIKSWKGIRHSLGLKVRGQRTRTTGRKGTPVGVCKRSLVLAEERKR